MAYQVFETNKYVYFESSKDGFDKLFAEVPRTSLSWQGEKKQYIKIELNEDNFDRIFDIIADADNINYHFTDTNELENKSVNEINIYNVDYSLSFYDWYLPIYDYESLNRKLANMLVDTWSLDMGNLHLEQMEYWTKGFSIISKPLYKYIFSLTNNLKSRREGLIRAYKLFDENNDLWSLATAATFKSRRDNFDPDKFIKNVLDSYETKCDYNDMAY